MKPGWEVKRLGEVADILDSKRRPITKSDRIAGSYPYYGATGVLGYVDGYLFDEPLLLLGEDGAKWGAGDRSAFPIRGKTWVNNHAHVLRPRRNLIVDAWLTYQLNAADLSPHVTGVTVPKLNQAKMRDIPVIVPPLTEQRRIVEVLDEAFAGLATATANAERTLNAARELFRGFVGDLFTNGQNEWPSRRLGDLMQIARGGSPRPIEAFITDDINGTNWIKISDATASRKYINSTAQRIKPEGAKRSRTVEPGDFLLSNSMSFGRPYIMRTSGCIHDGWLVLKDRDGVFDQDYLYAFLGSAAAYKQFDRLAAGSTVRNLNIELVERTVIPLPSRGEQSELAGVVDRLESEISRLENAVKAKLTLLAELKASLLQRAFAGELV